MAHTWTGGREERRDDPLAILDYIDAYQRAHANRSPLHSRMRAALNISAPSTLQAALQRLVSDELLTISAGGRGLTAELSVTELGRERLWAWRGADAAEPPDAPR
jgi:hypothetical protein